MRTYGRNPDGKWVVVESQNGLDDLVWATTLLQCLKLNLGESPFYADYGIPARQSLIQQVAPDFYAIRTQQSFAPHFANLVISREPNGNPPTYKVNVTTHQGVKLDASVPIPV